MCFSHWAQKIGCGRLEGGSRSLHLREPFTAVISDDSRADFSPNDADSHEPKFRVEVGNDVPQTHQAFERTLAPLLAVSQHLLLIDPYFDPGVARHQYLLPWLLVNQQIIRHVAIQVRHKDAGLVASSLKKLSLPANVHVKVQQLQERVDGPKLHNRFLLTEVAGVVVDPGFDTSLSDGHQYSLNLLPPAQYLKRVDEYWYHQAYDVLSEEDFTT